MSMDAATPSSSSDAPEATIGQDLANRYRQVTTRIAEAAHRAGRRPEEIVLVAVTKNAPMDVVRGLMALGHRDFGENRVQQLVNRAAQVEEFRQRLDEHPESATDAELVQPRWHMVGQLQRNKVRKLVDHVRLVHSVDSLRLAEEIQAQAARRDRQVEVLVEVNLGETQKGGIAPPAVRHLIDQMDSMLNVRVRGLMAMAPNTEDEAIIRNTFERCRELFEDVRRTVREPEKLDILSMGMSNDYEIAIEMGANVVRVGSALVGKPVVDEAEEEPDREEDS